ncbi:MAG: SigB/SigF/SigG family RNA polymerase sigma factor [Clostridia bacterium]
MTHKVVICGMNTAKLPKIKASDCDKLLQSYLLDGEENAKEQLIMCNLRLVLSIVQRFNNNGNNSDDLFQVGVVGLLKAINNFDLKYNVKFSTYAVPMIIGEIRRYLKEGSSIKISRSVRDVAYKAFKAREYFEIEENISPTISDIAKKIELPVAEVACALDAVSEPVSLYDTVYSDGADSLMLMEQIDDKKETENSWVENMLLRDALQNLPDKEKEILNLRYFIGKTQVEISAQIGMSQAQVSRLEKNAIKRLKVKIS